MLNSRIARFSQMASLVADGVAWYLDNFEASDEELLEALMARIEGPDFPTSGLIVGRRGISDAYRTGRGSIVMRAVVEVEEIQGRTCLVATELQRFRLRERS